MKLKYLEGVRGLAALSVVFFHYVGTFYPAAINGDPLQVVSSRSVELTLATTPINILFNGNFAVCVFFVLSGIVLTRKFFATQRIEVVIEGAFKRYPRLFIPAAFSILLLTALSYTGAKPIPLANMFQESFIGSFFAYQSGINPVLWTMTYELFGSFLVFGFCALFGSNNKRWIAYAVLLLFFGNGYYLAFVAGMILSDLMVNQRIPKTSVLFQVLFLGLGVFLGSVPNEIGLVEGSISLGETVYAFLPEFPSSCAFYHILGASLFIFGVISSPLAQRLYSTPAMEFLGRISFSMYLIHLAVIDYVSRFLFKYLQGLHFSYFLAFLITLVLSLALILFFSILVHRFIDAKAVKFSQYFWDKIVCGSRETNPLNRIFATFSEVTVLGLADLAKRKLWIFFATLLMLITTWLIVATSPEAFMRSNNLTVSIQIKTDVRDSLKLYYTNADDKRYFSEVDTKVQTLKRSFEFKTVSFNLPYLNVRKLRLDFGHLEKQVKIKEILVGNRTTFIPLSLTKTEGYYFNDIATVSNDADVLVLKAQAVDPYVILLQEGELVFQPLDLALSYSKVTGLTAGLSLFLIVSFLVFSAFRQRSRVEKSQPQDQSIVPLRLAGRGRHVELRD